MVDLSVSESESVLRLVDALEEHDDVQKVYANLNVPDEVVARMAR
jgi:transcriptional/translational regulatory protein YebC/TACO1